MDIDRLTPTQIAYRLKTKTYTEPFNHFPEGILKQPFQPASVLIPLLRKEEKWHILFIRRTVMEQDRHSGQVAFPGGRWDPEDKDAEEAALREACEEIGLCTDDVQLLGQLNDFITISNYQVTPIVGVIPWPYDLTPSQEEVDRIFTIPLTWLADSRHYKTTARELPNGDSLPVIYFQEYDHETLWGASARFLVEFLEILDLK
jgi:8-oxo-dGTP pyrophosphatase MutT (NUDIX family)